MRLAYCPECDEPMPPYSRVCPFCCYNKHFSSECGCQMTPYPFLEMMRGYLDEAMALPRLSWWQRVLRRDEATQATMRELLASFESVEAIVESSFPYNPDIVTAVVTLNDLLSDELEQRGFRGL